MPDPPGRDRYRRRIAAVPRTLVLQPDGYCNVSCGYCYLPEKDRRTPMPLRVAEAVASSAARFATPAAPVELVWHAGEPLTVGVRRFAELAEPFESLRRAGALHHYVQTNGTLISDRWCELFVEREVRVGVSIDGPADCNTTRVDRRGRPIFDRIVKGITRLRHHGIGFLRVLRLLPGCAGRQPVLRERQLRHHRNELLPRVEAGPSRGPVRYRPQGDRSMTLIELLATTEADVITDLVGATTVGPVIAKSDNRPTWDNWNKK
ncbi:radical SAM protein [Kitasatospora sp. NPDC059327]|uniref:radical SAM protein n=1 Tax=Kitasatospora sp. NPDC059327 TaxID=3346803 RepID=UPI00367F6A25